MDIVAAGHSSAEGSILLYRNDSQSNHNWVQFSLQSDEGDPFAIGANVTVYTQTGSQFSQVAAGNGYCSQNTLRQHFGLGEDTSIDSIVVSWPDNSQESYLIPNINMRYLLIKGTGNAIQLNIKNIVNAEEFGIMNLFPNPFNSTVQIHYTIDDIISNYSLKIFDITGRFIEEIELSDYIKGKNIAKWVAGNAPSGVYIIKFESDINYSVKKCILIK